MRLFNTSCRLLFLAPRLTLNFSAYLFAASKPVQSANFDLIIQRLKINVKKSQQMQKMLVEASLGESKVVFNQQKTRMEINKMAPLVALHQSISALLKNIADINDMLKQTSDPSETKILQQELTQLSQQKQQLKQQSLQQLIPPDLYDDVQEITLQFRSGAGGSESSLFVEEFSNMILSYCQGMGWRTQVVTAIKDGTINRGFRTLVVKVTGQECYKVLKCESGVHKVIRIPETEAKGRIHSSTISMVVMPSVPFDFNINEKDIRFEYMRSSGPGGQSVNKTESACRATHVPSGLSVMNQQFRSQDQNRKRAVEILKQKLFEIEYRKNVEEESRKRKSQVASMDRSEKIRTYNYPQDRITDHRTNLTMYGIDKMMSGQYLQNFIEAYQQKVYEEKLEALLEDLKNKNSQI